MAKKENILKKTMTGKGIMTGFCNVKNPSKAYDTYACSILLSKDDGEALVKQILDVRTEQFRTYGKGSRIVDITQCVPYKIVDPETGGEIPDKLGRYILKTSTKAYSKDGIPGQVIQVLDSKLKPTKANPAAPSEVRLGVILKGYTVGGKTGVSILVKMIQVLTLVEYQSDNPALFGLVAEDGYDFIDTEVTEDIGDGDESEALDF